MPSDRMDKRDDSASGFPADFLEYLPSVLAGGLAFGLWYRGCWVFGAVAMAAACGSFCLRLRFGRRLGEAQEMRRSLDSQLIQSQKLASIGELSSGIAHEINNPLAIIGQETEWIRHLLQTEELRDREGLGELADSVGEIAKQVDRCKEITHKLLDFARKKDPLIQKVDLNRLIEDMARLVEREALQRDIRIERRYGEDLPPVSTDPPLLRQVILNLLNNATHAVDRNGTIFLMTQACGSRRVDVLVSDSGCGIPEENMEKIFDPFFTTKPPGKGTGLGLSICHGIITRLGGRISVTSEVGKGTTFAVHLPLEYGKGEV